MLWAFFRKPTIYAKVNSLRNMTHCKTVKARRCLYSGIFYFCFTNHLVCFLFLVLWWWLGYRTAHSIGLNNVSPYNYHDKVPYLAYRALLGWSIWFSTIIYVSFIWCSVTKLGTSFMKSIFHSIYTILTWNSKFKKKTK